MLGLELLEANDIWLSFVEPSHEVFQPLVDVIDIEASDLHRSGLKPQRDCDLSKCAQFIICVLDGHVVEFATHVA